jgi:hypothetical protein
VAADFIRQAYHRSIIGMALGPYFAKATKGKKSRHGLASNFHAFSLMNHAILLILYGRWW